MTTHDLKILPEYFAAVAGGQKTFELRLDDRGYQTGDTLHLREWHGDYTGRSVDRIVIGGIRGPVFGLQAGYIILSLADPKSGESNGYLAACFDAAISEGLCEALAETQDERLKDLVERRLMVGYSQFKGAQA